MVNKIILVGNVGQDPEVRAFETGNSVARLMLATSERYTKDGESRTITEWHNIEAWGRIADIIDQYVRKGDKLYIEGKVHYEEYTPKDGVPRKRTVVQVRELKMLSEKRQGEGRDEQMKPQADVAIPSFPAQAKDDSFDLSF